MKPSYKSLNEVITEPDLFHTLREEIFAGRNFRSSAYERNLYILREETFAFETFRLDFAESTFEVLWLWRNFSYFKSVFHTGFNKKCVFKVSTLRKFQLRHPLILRLIISASAKIYEIFELERFGKFRPAKVFSLKYTESE